jgi:predicted transcriptional regulator
MGIEGATKTLIMFLLERGLIDEIPKQTKNHGNEKFVYKITERGLRLLHLSHEIMSIVGLD